eukprot:3838342-Prymnesium_polylepis.2
MANVFSRSRSGLSVSLHARGWRVESSATRRATASVSTAAASALRASHTEGSSSRERSIRSGGHARRPTIPRHVPRGTKPRAVADAELAAVGRQPDPSSSTAAAKPKAAAPSAPPPQPQARPLA